MLFTVKGCVVNGPGKSKHANIGISLPGSGERPVATVYVDGVKTVTLKGESIAEDFKRLVDDYVAATYAGDSAARARLAAPAKKGQGGESEADSGTIPIRATH